MYWKVGSDVVIVRLVISEQHSVRCKSFPLTVAVPMCQSAL